MFLSAWKMLFQGSLCLQRLREQTQVSRSTELSIIMTYLYCLQLTINLLFLWVEQSHWPESYNRDDVPLSKWHFNGGHQSILLKSISVTVLLVCPGWPPDVSVCWAHGLLFVGAMCSHVDCLSPPILLRNHCFSGSSCVCLVTLVCLPI